MSIPSFLTNGKRTAMAVFVMIFALSGITLQAQKTGRDVIVPEAPQTNLDQCANGKQADGPPVACAGGAWVNGNIHGTNSQWVENQYVPYRVIISGVGAGATGVGGIQWDTSEGNKHALDFIGTYNATNPADPCNVVVNGCGAVSTFPIPPDPRVTALRNGGQQPAGVLTIWGGVINSVGSDAAGTNGLYAYTGPADYSGTSQAGFFINFTADNDVDTPVVISWSGHISSRLDWGLTNTAIGIQGSSYHMRLLGGGGNTDRSMSVAGVIFPGLFSVRKWAIQRNGTLTFNQPFGFNPTTNNFLDANNVPVTSFSIIDSNADPNFALYPSPNDSFAGKILDFTNPITVNEAQKAGWSTSDVSCEEFDGGLGLGRAIFSGITIGTAVPFTPASASATLQEGAVVRCTFTNQQAAAPTAAEVSVDGRVVSTLGRGLSGVSVKLYNANTGETLMATTNSFGYFRFFGLEIGDLYSLRATSKLYSFPDGEVSFNLNDNLSGITIIGYGRSGGR